MACTICLVGFLAPRAVVALPGGRVLLHYVLLHYVIGQLAPTEGPREESGEHAPGIGGRSVKNLGHSDCRKT